MLYIFMGLAVWEIVKWQLQGIFERIYGLRYFGSILQTAEIEGSFPMLIVLLGAGFLPMVAAELNRSGAVTVWLIVFAAFWGVYLVTLSIELRRQSGSSMIGNFLYICALEIIPPLLLL
jgi:hypothetical protein